MFSGRRSWGRTLMCLRKRIGIERPPDLRKVRRAERAERRKKVDEAQKEKEDAPGV